eukprot:TRINITY_DN6915_c0_g1_i1.p1 TRINITY_DN6915_c0_g1~~TRINITY_DN6915_c0_g1_i1.p1  ORF type:complete len:165 (-),score=32.61 TRINITY_DN6915_c0_g1_i1:42-536(-)
MRTTSVSSAKSRTFGGQHACAGGPGEDDDGVFRAELLVCASCTGGDGPAAGEGVRNCEIHGTDFIEYKCYYCCAIAQWFCWNTTHMCHDCHTTQAASFVGTKMSRRPAHHFPPHWVFDLKKCGQDESTWPSFGLSKCPLGVAHPKNSTKDWSLGCAVCRQEKEF